MKLIAIKRIIDVASAGSPTDTDLARAKRLARCAAQSSMALAATAPLERQDSAPSQQRAVRLFLSWLQRANPDERVQAAKALARVYLQDASPVPPLREAKFGEIDLRDLTSNAEFCLAALAQDPSDSVRQALAWELADSELAPRQIVSALAFDEPEIATIVLARSPVLTDAELSECASTESEDVQIALARRQNLNAEVVDSLAETDRRAVVMALIENPVARLTPQAMSRIAQSFGGDCEVCDALLERPGLPAALRYDLIASAIRALPIAAFGPDEKRSERMIREALERCAIGGAQSCPPGEVRDLMRRLRATGGLTIALLLRALVCGDRGFFIAAAAELTGVSPERTEGFVREPFGVAFAALFRRMGLPGQFLRPFRVALAALEQCEGEKVDTVLLPVISRIIASCQNEGSAGFSRLLSLLHRLEAEAVLAEARTALESVATPPFEFLLTEPTAIEPPVVIERGLARMLDLLCHLEEQAEHGSVESGAEAPVFQAESALSEESLDAWFTAFGPVDFAFIERMPAAVADALDSQAA
jgi:uncharacterized protein (DUF2336 family)